MILDLIDGKAPVLHQPTQRFNFAEPQMDPVQLAYDLTETMIQNKGLGLSANQVGLPYCVFVLTGQPVRALFNPRIVHSSEETTVSKEGCLSFPELFVKVKRPAIVKIRYTQANGETLTEEFHGLTARIVQHEIDHLNGITILDRAHPIHLEAALRAQKQKMRKKK